MNATLQFFDGVVVIKHNGWRQPSPLPVVDALLHAGLSVNPKEFGEGGVTAGGLNDQSGLGCIHGADINISFTAKSNGMFTSEINRLFSLERMERVIDRILRWEGDKSPADVARDLKITPQRLNNWKQRDVPSRQFARLAKHYGRSIEVLAGTAEEDDPILSELLAIWKVLIPESRRTVLGHAKFVRTVQNPVGETGTHPLISGLPPLESSEE